MIVRVAYANKLIFALQLTITCERRHPEYCFLDGLTKGPLSEEIQLVTIQVVHLQDMGFFESRSLRVDSQNDGNIQGDGKRHIEPAYLMGKRNIPNLVDV